MKQYNILTQQLPEAVVLFEKEYPVYTSFKNWIRIYNILSEKGLKDAKKLAKALALCYKDELPPNIVSAILGMLIFLNRGADIFAPRKKSTGPCFSFVADADIIYSAFYQRYGIDLLHQDMHWHKFCALFSSLSYDNHFGSVIKIRTMEERDIKDASKRRKLRDLKKAFSIENTQGHSEVDVAKELSSLF